MKSGKRKQMNPRYRLAESRKASAVEEPGLLEEISALRGQVEKIGERLYLLECVEVCRQREARHPEGDRDVPLEVFLRESAAVSKGK